MSENHNDLSQMADKAERTIGALVGAFMRTADAAARQLEMATELAEKRSQMHFEYESARLRAELVFRQMELICAQREALERKLAGAPRPLQLAMARQIEILQAQEMGILVGEGLAAETAEEVLTVSADKMLPAPAPKVQASEGEVVVETHKRRRPKKEADALRNGHCTQD